MKVYVVSIFIKASQFILSVFDTKEKAIEYVNILLNGDRVVVLNDNSLFVNMVNENSYLIEKMKVE